MFIQNHDQLATTEKRQQLLQIIESGIEAIQPDAVFDANIKLENNILYIQDNSFNLDEYENLYVLGFGKGSARNAKKLETLLGDRIREGYVIDTQEEQFKIIKFTEGTHPVVSQQNVDFTFKVMDRFSRMHEKDLVLVIVCGGGSAMLEHPHSVSLEQKINIEKALLKSGATIIEMNKIRQHLSDVKGGGLAQILYPATVVSLIYSDVPGNDIAYIASGPTVKDNTSIEDAMELVRKFQIPDVQRESFNENPSDDKYFEKVKNCIILSNLTALHAMENKAKELGINASIYSDKYQGEARYASVNLLEELKEPGMLLAGGETTVTATGNGVGGRNQEATLSTLIKLPPNTLYCSFASDGWDNSEAAGAIADSTTQEHAENKQVDPQEFLNNNDSYTFFQTTQDAIMTGRLPSNVADLMIVWKWI